MADANVNFITAERISLLEPTRIEPVGPTGQLILDEQFEEFEVWEGCGLGLRDAAGERFDRTNRFTGSSLVP